MVKLHLVLIRIAEQCRPGSASPQAMGMLTKVQLTTGLIPKTGTKQDEANIMANMIKIETRLFPMKRTLTIGSGCCMGVILAAACLTASLMAAL